MSATDYRGWQSEISEASRLNLDHRKRKRRRRRAGSTSLSASLISNNHLKGDIGALSTKLWLKLFGNLPTESESNLRYVAVSSWFAATPDVPDEGQWTVLPVKPREADMSDEPSALQWPSSSSALGPLCNAFDNTKLSLRSVDNEPRAEIRVLDVEPLLLDSVLVTIDGDGLTKHFEVQKTFGGGFGTHINGTAGKGKGKAKRPVNGDINDEHWHPSEPSEEDHLIRAVREALASLYIVRQGDPLSLPLPTHPITHVSLPPAQITMCEPVSQGLMAPSTRITVNREYGRDHRKTYGNIGPRKDDLSSLRPDQADDASSERFFSSAEERIDGDTADAEDDQVSSTTSTNSNSSESSSNNSSDDTFSMGPPGFGFMTSNSATWTAGSRNGEISPPGSVYSNFTATTARQSVQDVGRFFTARPLMSKIPDEILRPKPLGSEDEQARVYVDIKMLMKLRTFSGDWIRLQASQLPNNNTWGYETFGNRIASGEEYRVARIYGLPDLSHGAFARYAKGATVNKSSEATIPVFGRPSPEAWMSPNLLANLGNPDSVRISPLAIHEDISSPGRRATKLPASSNPPKAKEVTLLMVSTPLATEQLVQVGIMASTKHYFQTKSRLLIAGDLIPVTFDIEASRMLAGSSTAPEADIQIPELLSVSLEDRQKSGSGLGVAWLRVAKVVATDSQDNISADIWGGAMHMDPSVTRTIQAGNERCKLPSSESGFEYYLGLKPAPKPRPSTGVVGRATQRLPKAYISPLRRRLRELIAAATSPRAIQFGVDPIVILLHSSQRNVGKTTIATQSVSDLGLHAFQIDAYDILTEGSAGGDVKTEGIFQARVERALTCGAQYTAIIIRHIEALTASRMISALRDVISSSRILIATTTEIEDLPESLRSIFTHELELPAPDESEREALKSAALVAGDLVDIVDRAVTARQVRLETLLASNAPPDCQVLIRDILLTGDQSMHSLTSSDFDSALATARKSFAASIGAPKIPSVAWSDVGGLAHIKDSIIETIQLH